MTAVARYSRRYHVALLALFVGLGGTSVAAGKLVLPRNSVGTAQLANGAVTKRKISQRAVIALTHSRGLAGARGARGLQGTQGSQGLQGPAGGRGSPGTHLIVRYGVKGVPSPTLDSVDASCAAGEHALGGGGGNGLVDSTGDAVVRSEPLTDGARSASGSAPNGWRIVAAQQGSSGGAFEVWVLCS